MIVACISASKVPSTTANSIQVMKTCQAISQLGHEVHLYVPTTGHPENLDSLWTYYGLSNRFGIEWLASRSALRRYDFAAEAVRQARRIKAQIAYVWPIQAGIFSLLAGIPVIMELNGPPEGTFGPTLFRIFMKLRGKKRLLPITHALADQLGRRYSVDTKNAALVQVSPNGVDLERYANLPEPASARAQLGLPPALTVGYTGHLYPGRGMGMLVELAQRFPQLSFLWVGGNELDVNAWRDQLFKKGITNVTLTGFVENNQLPLYQAAADILLMPYEKEIQGSSGGDSSSYASPMKMFEYMACRRPMISSDLPVITEILNSSNAILCPAQDTGAWAQALATLIADEGKRAALATQARSDVQQYTWQERLSKAFIGFPS
jgi:glycosyltransferase involved in cell wall biosynthesis